MTDHEKRRRVDQIIAYWNDPRQKMREALTKAAEAKRLGIRYSTVAYPSIDGEALFLADAIGWASRD